MLKLRDLDLNYTNSEQATIVWLKGIGAALKNSANCNKCGSVCNFVIKKGSYCWRYPKSGCQSVISMRDGSFFSGSHLKLNEIVEVSYWWACEASVFNTFCGSNHWGTHSTIEGTWSQVKFMMRKRGVMNEHK